MTTQNEKTLHRCNGCDYIASSKCKIFIQSTAMMETILAYRHCCFKEINGVKA
jgi:hypothetical protein